MIKGLYSSLVFILSAFALLFSNASSAKGSIKTDFDLLLIGEAHGEHNQKRAEIIRAFAEDKTGSEGKVCLFYELAADKDINQHIQHMKYRRSKGDDNRDILESFEVMHQAATSYNLTEIPIDDEILLKDYFSAHLCERNQTIAKRALYLFNEKKCSSALMFIGHDHLFGPDSTKCRLQTSISNGGLKILTKKLGEL